MSVKALAKTLITAVAQCITDDNVIALIPYTKDLSAVADKSIPGIALATTVTKSLAQAIAPELMGSFIEEIEYQKLREWLRTSNPNHLNHDLGRLLKKAAITSIGYIERLYVDKLKSDGYHEQTREVRQVFSQLKSELKSWLSQEYLEDSILEDPSDCLNAFSSYILRFSFVDETSDLAQFFTQNLPFCFDLACKEALKDKENDKEFKAFQIWILETINEKITSGNAKILAEITALRAGETTNCAKQLKNYLEQECKALHVKFDAILVVLVRVEDKIDSLAKGQNEIKGILEGNSFAKYPKELTLKIPKIHASEVIGRESEVEDLRKLLFDNKHVVVVNGLGGIGKTTLAQAYLSKYYDDYQHIAWISQSSEALETDFVNADGLKETLRIDATGKDLPALFKEILLKLHALTDKPNLLLIDNAEASLTGFIDRLPHQPNWHLLVTSRENIERLHAKELGFLTADNALTLFKTHCTLIKDDEAIHDLLKIIDYHTLTIEILAKTAQKQRIPIAQLKTAIEADLKAPVFIKHKGDKIDKVRSYLSSIFDLSKLNTHEVWLMKQLAFLPAEFHSYELLVELLAPSEPQLETFAETLANLVAKGWLLLNGETDSYKIHRIIAEVTRKKLAIELDDLKNLVETVTKKLRIDQTKDNPIDKFVWIPYGNILTGYFEQEDDSTVSSLQNNLALVLKELGDYQEAKLLLEKATRSDEKNFGIDHPSTATRYSNLALVLKELGDYQEAKLLLEKATRSDEKNFGIDHPTTAVSYSNLALVLKALGDYQGAKKLLEKATRSDEKNFGNDHPSTATGYSNLATVLKELGDYQGAKLLLEKATRSDEKNFGIDHPTTAVSYSNLALVLKELGDYQEAKLLLEKATRSDEKNFGNDHPSTAQRYSNLALVLKALGDYQGAKLLLEKATHSDEKNFGNDHPSTAVRYSNLALVLKELGDYQGAKLLLEKATHSDEKNFGNDHPSTAVRYSNLALVLKELGDYQEAKLLLEKATRSDEKNFGNDHPTTAVSYSNLALVLKDLGDYQGAKLLLEKATRSNEKNFGIDHPSTATTYSNLALVLKELGDYQEAKLLLEKATHSDEKNFGNDHPSTAVRYSNLAMVLCDLKDFDRAVYLLEKAYMVYRNLVGEQHPTTKTIKRNLDFVKRKKPTTFFQRVIHIFKK
ncbi:MAG: tetratricopeptide repeat protein [Spirosomataceae bacterium]